MEEGTDLWLCRETTAKSGETDKIIACPAAPAAKVDYNKELAVRWRDGLVSSRMVVGCAINMFSGFQTVTI